ncbi:MAG: glycosyltransferase [Planctomycetes bacterium]|nr:glycosyltransferase [Planctomycetota bacterium]
MPAQYEAVIKHVEPGETVIVASGAAVGARIAHETLRVPMASIVLQPAVIRSLHRTPVVAGVPALPTWLPPSVKRPFLWVFDRIADWLFCIAEVNAFRASLGLRPVKSLVKEWWLSPQRVIALFPDWYGMPQPDWSQQIRMTGFPLYDDPSKSNTLADDVQQFLDTGDPPIVFTPGTGMMHGRAFFDAAVGACRILGRRALLLTRHTEQLPPTLPDSVRYVSYVPFSELLPRAAAIVHHGGVGTLAQALAAGIPQLVMPMAYDQPDNAARLKSLGVGDWLKRSAFRAPAVAQKLRYLLESKEVAARCRTLAQRVDKTRGLRQACDLIEELGNRNTQQNVS